MAEFSIKAVVDAAIDRAEQPDPLAALCESQFRAMVDESLRVWRICEARRILREELADPGFRQGYVANIAMLLHDRYDIHNMNLANAAASDILAMIFVADA